MSSFYAKHKNILGFALVGLVFAGIWIYFFHGLVYDDAYIAYRFSSNWASGHGLVWNVGEDPVEGFTSFAWVLIGALFQLVGLLPPRIMPWIGVAAWFATVSLLVPRLADAVSSDLPEGNTRRRQVIKVLVFVGLAANSALAFQAFQGLETTLFIMAGVLVVYQGVVSRTRLDFIKLAVCSLFLIMVRPDGAFIVLPVWLIAVLLGAGSRRNALVGLGTMLLLVGIYTAIKWSYFGYPFPNTFYIKEDPQGLSGQYYVRDYLTILSPLLVFMLYACGRLGVVRTLSDRTFMLLIVPATLFTVAYAAVNPILGNVYRFLIPSLPLFALAGMRIWSLADEKAAQEAPAARAFFSLGNEAFLLFALTLVTVCVVFNIRVIQQYAFLRGYFGAIDETLVPRGRQLQAAAQLNPPPLTAIGDIGAIPYYSGLPIFDIIGLADESVAHNGLTHTYIQSRKADLLILQDFRITKNSQILACGPQGYTNPHLVVEDKHVQLDLTFYSKILSDPEQEHTGKGSTYQIVTTPGFADDYQFISIWNFGESHYYVFVRRAYPQFEALAKLMKSIH